MNFKGGNVLGTVITGGDLRHCGLSLQAYCQDVTGGLNIGSPLTSGLGNQDLSYVSASNPGVGNGLSTTADIAEYTLSYPTNTDFKQYNGRLDADVTQNDHLSFAIYWVPDTLTFYNGGYGYDLFHHSQVNDAFSLIWNHTFSPTFLNEARANAAGWRYNELTSTPRLPLACRRILLPQSGTSVSAA